MNVVIIGAGRMGCRHAIGAASVDSVEHICIVDLVDEALVSAKTHIKKTNEIDTGRFSFARLQELNDLKREFDVGIIASTVNARRDVCEIAIARGCETLLIEKPLGQSMSEVHAFIDYINGKGITAAVNLSTRQYPGFIKLKQDFNAIPQLRGEKVISLNAGAAGIGGNGVHWLDLIFYLLDAERAELVAGEIETSVIKSGRGPQFEDNGGWCTVKFYGSRNKYVGRAHLSLTASSSALGGWDIIAPHGRVRINLSEGIRTDILRKPGSTLPIYQYAGDYQPAADMPFERPVLEDLSRKWLENIIDGRQILPTLEEGLKTHQLLFDWLSLNKEQKKAFAFT